MAMKIASRKKKIPSIAKAIPKASPKGSIIPGHSSPNSKERTVPLTAPTANSTATALDQRRARRSASASPLLRPRYSAISITAGKATPRQARTIWKPSVNAIWLRAARRFDPASASSGVKSGIESPSGAGGRGDAEPLEFAAHRLGQGVETAHRPHHDGQLDNLALGVEAQQVDALQLAVADARVEDQGGHVSVLDLVPVAEVLEDVQRALDEDRRDDGLALVRLEDDRAPEDDALGEGLGERLAILGLHSRLEGIALHCRPEPTGASPPGRRAVRGPPAGARGGPGPRARLRSAAGGRFRWPRPSRAASTRGPRWRCSPSSRAAPGTLPARRKPTRTSRPPARGPRARSPGPDPACCGSGR